MRKPIKNLLRIAIAAMIMAFTLFACVSYQPVSKFTGGRGLVVTGGVPVTGARVSIADVGGILDAATDQNGRFDIAVDTTKRLFPSMAEPMMHEVTVTVEKDGVVLKTWKFEKGALGPNYFEFGAIEVAP